ncbi:helix-turn-helix transcriptional regulator [Nodosilinea sp. FACHB-13]|uniref:helix-turn-helix domain-containing protein n=1 Tax=Cyanophyceae TaxID=3028117 RepID=UPI0016833F03|nr:helix-turn-helix transcriptional regulator [Nodosilinea sp. FACHB-13]MBD2106056.1 helix-turn-helix transcriptional regulator [Nodosilinea sp. FACHB-13]
MSSSVYSLRYQQFLARLKAARLEAHLTQQQVAARLSVPQSFVSKCESGERRVDVIELLEFASIYDKPLMYFVDFESPSEQSFGKPSKR